VEAEGLLPFSQDPATGPYLSQTNPVHNFSPYFPKLHSNINLPSMPKSSVCSTPFRFTDKIFLCISNFMNVCYMARSSHMPLFDHSNYIWRSLQVMKFLIMQSSPASLHFISLRSKYSLLHPVKIALHQIRN